MEPFKLSLSNGATVTGLHNRPQPSSPGYGAIEDGRRPLVIAIHGGTYSSKYFDADAKHTASLCSNSLGVPVVAIDRPLYQGTTSFYPIPEGKNYHEELAVWLHKYILPAVWSEFGHGCSGVVLHCHSLAVPSAVIVAGWEARERAGGRTPSYPLDSMTISGFGTQKHPEVAVLESHPPPDPTPMFDPTLPARTKDAMIIPEGTADPAVYALTEKLDCPMPYAERADYGLIWFPDGWRALCEAVRVPVLIGMAEHDRLWMGTGEHAEEFAGGFTGSERVEYSVVKEAPHCIELSFMAQGWYARCFGWALECAAASAARRRS